MKIFLVFSLNVLLTLESDGNYKESVDYYVNLINRERARISASQLPDNSHAYRPVSNKNEEYGTFDHIVVGAGAAGAIIASRLSDDPSISVLLIEAGGGESDFTNIPAMATILRSSEYNWNYYTVPQKAACLAMEKQQCPYAMGKGRGGGTVINSLIYARGNARDYDDWYRQGNDGWSFTDVLPFFKKTENSKIEGDKGYHGFGGKINVEYVNPEDGFDAFLQANRELHRHIGDYNGKNPLTVGKMQFNTIEGRRGSTNRAFLRPFCDQKKNLKTLINSYATKILINNKTAYGIRFAKDQQFFIAKSRKAIVISASPIGSPQILMSSGIGPKLHLQELGIPVEQDLPVGNYLKNHFSVALNFFTNYTETQKDLAVLVEEFLHSKGTLTNTDNAIAVGFFQTNVSKIPHHPDIEMTVMKGGSGSPLEIAIDVVILHPKSIGTLKLKSADPFDYPLIDPNVYSDPEDIETMYQGIKLALKLLNTKAFRRYSVTLKPSQIPACEKYTYLSKAFWYCYIQQLTLPYSHSIGTCKMGPDPLNGAVVDRKLKVYGINNLRVADASIMPDLNSGHTSAPSMMIGEKAAHMIQLE